MKITNQTRNTLLAEKIIVPKTLWDKTLGLLKYQTPVAMLLTTRYGIHTIFMRYPIDVLILDKQNRVMAIKENLRPNHIFLWNPTFETVIELPEGTIKRTKTEINDQLKFL
jgi:uncharacterized membrane protein (UPF0127 family)